MMNPILNGRAGPSGKWRSAARRGALAAILFVLAMQSAVRSHSWYPAECCSDRDCAPYPSEQVTESAAGFTLAGGEFIPRSTARFSPDGDYHVCRNPHTQALICFFVPNRGV